MCASVAMPISKLFGIAFQIQSTRRGDAGSLGRSFDSVKKRRNLVLSGLRSYTDRVTIVAGDASGRVYFLQLKGVDALT